MCIRDSITTVHLSHLRETTNSSTQKYSLNAPIEVQYEYIVLLLDYRVIVMTTSTATRINFRTDTETKQSAEKLFDALGLDMTTALNMFLKQAVREDVYKRQII